MLTVILTALFGAGVALGLYFGDVFGYGWSTFWGVVAFGAANAVAGWRIQKKVKALMEETYKKNSELIAKK